MIDGPEIVKAKILIVDDQPVHALLLERPPGQDKAFIDTLIFPSLMHDSGTTHAAGAYSLTADTTGHSS